MFLVTVHFFSGRDFSLECKTSEIALKAATDLITKHKNDHKKNGRLAHSVSINHKRAYTFEDNAFVHSLRKEFGI